MVSKVVDRATTALNSQQAHTKLSLDLISPLPPGPGVCGLVWDRRVSVPHGLGKVKRGAGLEALTTSSSLRATPLLPMFPSPGLLLMVYTENCTRTQENSPVQHIQADPP
jgi:hypothetical protein